MLKSNFLIAGLIVLISAAFRITNLDLIEFKADEGINLFLASRPIFGHPFPPTGIISSAGIPNPPFFNYLLLPIVYITLDPKAISLIIGSINSLAIGLFFLLIHRYYGRTTAFVSSIFIALSPWSVLFSRKLWMQDFIFLFIVAILYSLHKIVLDKKDFFWLPYTTFCLFLIQLYHPTIFFVFLTTMFLLIQKARPHIRYIVIGIFLGILPLLPYLAYELQHGCRDCSSFIRVREKLAIQSHPEMFLRPLQIVGQGNFQFILGKDMHTFASDYPFVYELRKLLYVQYIFLPLGIILFWKRYTKLRFIVYTIILLPFVYFLLRLEPFMHYFAMLIPILFLFIGLVFSNFFSYKTLSIKLFFSFIFIALLITYVSFNTAFFDLLNKQKGLEGDYGPSFKYTEKLTEKRFHKYLNDKHYKEMVVASFVDPRSIAGSTILAQALYQQKQTEKNINQLDQRLKEVPEDSRVENEVLAYYTLLPKTKETMNMLRKKTIQNPHYYNIYEEIYKHYLAKNLIKAYRSTYFSLEYPQHWSLEDLSSDSIMLKIDEFYMAIIRDYPTNKDLIKLMQDDIIEQKTYKIKHESYIIFYKTSLKQSQSPPITNEKLNDVIKEFDRVVISIRNGSL